LEGLVARDPPIKNRAEYVAELEGPPCPESLTYLLEWSGELLGRSGIGPTGFAPLGYHVIESWARLTGRTVTSDEVRALVVLDAVRLNPGKEKSGEPDGEE